MDKLAFLETLKSSGYKAALVMGVPTIMGEASEATKIRNIAKEAGYNESFGIKKNMSIES